MLRFSRASFLAVFLASSLATPAAQESPDRPSAAQGDDQTLTLSTTVVTVEAAVLDKQTGRPVGGLTREDFEVFEDGERRAIEFFARDEAPLSVAFLFDVSMNAQVYQEQLREAALRALARLRPHDEVAVLAYGMDAEVVRDFSKDKTVVAAVIANLGGLVSVDTIPVLRGNVSFAPGTVLNKGVFLAAKTMNGSAAPKTRRAIVVVSPENKPVQIPFKGPSRAEVLRELSECDAVVCGLILDLLPIEVPHPVGALKALAIRTGVRTYADATGGTVVKTNSFGLGAALSDALDGLRARYSLGYYYVSPKKAGAFRKIKVRLAPAAERRIGKVSILARKGYYATQRSTQAGIRP